MHTLDKIGREIIRLLNEDGRMSSAEIARRLGGVPPRTISHRVEGLIHFDQLHRRWATRRFRPTRSTEQAWSELEPKT